MSQMLVVQPPRSRQRWRLHRRWTCPPRLVGHRWFIEPGPSIADRLGDRERAVRHLGHNDRTPCPVGM